MTRTLHMIYDLAGRPSLEKSTLAGPAYTLSVEGTAALLALGARVVGPAGVDHNTMEHLLGTDSRNPAAKHRILEMYVEHGFEPPDTPVMALHRGLSSRSATSGSTTARDSRMKRASRACCWTTAPTPTFGHLCGHASRRDMAADPRASTGT